MNDVKTLKHVIKRDNSREVYEIIKIKKVVELALKKSNASYNEDDLNAIILHIENELGNFDSINIEEIQNIVEKSFMVFKFYDTAKHYIEYRNDRNNSRKTNSYITKIPDNVKTPWGMLGYITFKRTYARRFNDNSDDDDNKTEEYRDTILRVLDACQKQLNVGFTNEELKNAYSYLMSLKCSIAGRFLWQLGTKTVDKLGLMSLQNCAFIVIDEPVKPFTWIFDVLMLGTGVGFNIQKEYIDKIPNVLDNEIKITRVDTKDADFIIPDSREGWVSFLEKVLEAYFYKGKSFTYSTILIRTAGAKIKSFGGTASGPEDLVKGINNIQTIFAKKRGQKLSSVDCLDIINIIASIVVAGNVRRCLPANSLVHTKEGLVKIKNIKEGDLVLTSSGYEKVSNIFVQGKQKLIKIITQDGEFECTHNHKMAVIDDGNNIKWIMASDLKKWDSLKTSRVPLDGTDTTLPKENNLKEITIPELDADIAWFIGIIQSNKNISINDNKSLYITFDKNNLSIVTKIQEVLKKIGSNLDVKVRYNKNEEYPYEIHCHSEELINYIVTYIKYYDIDVPEYIKKAKQEIRLAYLAGILDGSGNVKSAPINLISTSSSKFAKEVQKLCYASGFESKLVNSVYNHKVDIITLHSQKILSHIPQLINKIEINPLSIDSYFNAFNYHTTKVLHLENDDCYDETYDIEVENKHEFYCNGYLTHNSALIALGDYDDIPYLKSKDWSSGNIPNWRCMSNNSVVCDDTDKLPKEFWEGYNGSSEPYGLINIDLSRKIGRIKDGDKYPDPEVKGYNPCFSGETLIATADGRGAVSIKQLAEEGKDVPVYSVNENGMVEIKWGRNPRITGKNQKMVKVILDDGKYVKTTLNHKFRLIDGTLVEAKDLQPKMSLTRFTKTLCKVKNDDNTTYISVNTNTTNNKTNKYFEHRLIAKFFNPDKFNDLYDENINNGIIKGNVIVHHKDYNGLNNSPENLEIMTFEEHSKLHGDHDQCGENNGMYGKKQSEYTKRLIGQKTKERCEDPEYREKLSMSQKKSYENDPGLKIKKQEKMKKIQADDYKGWCEQAIKSTDLETLFVDGILNVKKVCENCEDEFTVPFIKREVCYCSINCSNKCVMAIENRRVTRNIGIKETQKQVLHDQIMIYKDLQEKLQRDPLKKEWGMQCKKQEIPFRIRDGISYNSDNEYLLKSYQDLKNRAVDYNHRIKSIEFLEDTETVYNITVDNNHTVGLITSYDKDLKKCDGIFTPQCGEISLANYATCCLGEIFLPNITSFEEFKNVATVSYRICKHSLLLKCHQEETEKVVYRHSRIGIGITGFMQSSEEQKSWLSPLYEYLREYDVQYSAKHNIPTSIKLTTVKPSGTLSLLAGVTSGCHPGIYQYFIRRIRISSTSNLIPLCKSKGYFIEYQRNFDGSDDKNTMIVEFPCMYPIGTKLANDMTAIDQLEMVKYLQTNWSDNSVSCTVYYRLEELEDVKKWLSENYKDNVKTCSFLLHNDHGFMQAPFEEITKEKYEELIKKVVPITSGNIDIEMETDYTAECPGGVCPIR